MADGPSAADALTPLAAASPPSAQESVTDAGAAGPGTGVPMQARSMRPYWHVFIAFGLTWGLVLVYVISVGRRFSELEDEARRLRS